MADHTSPGDSYAAPKVNWNDPALTGIDRIQYYATSGQVAGVAERPMPVTLVLTREEAQTIRDILALVSGTRREQVSAIVDKLIDYGVYYRSLRGFHVTSDSHIQFTTEA